MATDALLSDLGQGAEIGSTDGTGFDSEPSGEESLSESTDGDGPNDGTRQDGERQDGQQQGDKTDGRRGPANIRNSIKSASEQMPEHAPAFKELGNAYFREQAYRQVFPTPAEATDAKNLIESVGGLDGITQLQQRDQMYSAQDEFLRDGNPEVIDDFFEDFPEGAAALAPHYLDRLAQTNHEAYSKAIAPHAVAMLEQAGLGDYLRAIVGEKDAARKDALATRLIQWFEQQQRGAADIKTTQGQSKNPGNDRLSRRETELNQREEQIFKTQTDSHVTSKVTPELNKTVEQFAKRNKWNEDQKAEFRSRLLSDIAAQMDKDAGYKKQAELRYSNKGRTSASVGDYVANEFIRRMNDKDGALATESRFNKLIGKGQRPATQQNNGQRQQVQQPITPGLVYVDKLPSNDKIDWNHKDAETWFLLDKVRLKTGQIVQVRKRQ